MSWILLSHIFEQTHCRTAGLNSILLFQVTLSDVFLSSTWFGSSAINTPIFSTLSSKKVRSNSVYILIDICSSLATVNLNKLWVSAFSPVASLIFGRMCLLKYDCQSSVNLLPESNKMEFEFYGHSWTPWGI